MALGVVPKKDARHNAIWLVAPRPGDMAPDDLLAIDRKTLTDPLRVSFDALADVHDALCGHSPVLDTPDGADT